MANEKRLIDANALQKEIERIYSEHYEKSCYKFIHDFFRAMLRRIRICPTVDAVEVVRCKDCKKTENHGADHEVFCTLIGAYMGNNDFCSYGERK